MSRILVLSASVGAGHMRAAEAVELALRALAPEHMVENHDVLTFTNAVFRRLYGTAYLDLVNRAPHVLGYFYDMLDRPSRSGRNRGDRLRLAVEKLNLRRFEELLTSQHWDLVINTHFLPAELIARLRQDGKLSLQQATVCTDFFTHRLWVNQPCDRYFCATDEGAAYLAHWGVPRGDIEVTGIPVHPAFSQPADRQTCQSRHGLGDQSGLAGTGPSSTHQSGASGTGPSSTHQSGASGTDHERRPVLLQLCGGFGVGPVEAYYRALLAIGRPIELVVVCGRNEELKADLEAVPRPERRRVHLLGFTRQIDELMACADLIVTKPGGLTTSEAMARGLPMAIANPIPGQESQNSDYLLERGAAIKLHHPALATLKVSQLLENPVRLEQMRQAAVSLGRPQAAFDVARRSLALIEKRPFD